MARTPRASVSKTSGQAISRGSYQKGYALAHSADAPAVKSSGSAPAPAREYGKSGSTTIKTTPMNVSYGDTYEPSDLKDVQSSFTSPPKKGFK